MQPSKCCPVLWKLSGRGISMDNLEDCGGGSVADLIGITEEPLDESQIAYVCREALKGLAYLHSIFKVHRDIKGDNILLTEQGEVKLGKYSCSLLCFNLLAEQEVRGLCCLHHRAGGPPGFHEGVLKILAAEGSGRSVARGRLLYSLWARRFRLSEVQFCCKELDARLLSLGAERIVEKGLGVDQHPSGYEGALDPWLLSLWRSLNETNLSLIPRISDIMNPNLNIFGDLLTRFRRIPKLQTPRN